MSTVRTPSIGHAFPDPVHGAQAGFRTLLGALSEPGTTHALVAQIGPPPTLHAATAICLLTLADQDTKLWLSPRLASEAATYLRFHCGAPLTSVAMDANFAVLTVADHIDLSTFNVGDDRYPDRSTTVIIQCAALRGGTLVSLTGPGVREALSIAPAGLSGDFWQQAADNHARYPLGIDLLLVSGSEVIALPRSTSITLAKEHC
jgi:alpha-D-ribose 1-methylphosphonate 5-triphosphate synthase subunit PhnH